MKTERMVWGTMCVVYGTMAIYFAVRFGTVGIFSPWDRAVNVVLAVGTSAPYFALSVGAACCSVGDYGPGRKLFRFGYGFGAISWASILGFTVFGGLDVLVTNPPPAAGVGLLIIAVATATGCWAAFRTCALNQNALNRKTTTEGTKNK